MDLMDWIKLMLLLFNIYTPVSHQNGISSASIHAKVAILFTVGKDFSFWYQNLNSEIADFSSQHSKNDIMFYYIQSMNLKINMLIWLWHRECIHNLCIFRLLRMKCYQAHCFQNHSGPRTGIELKVFTI